MPSTNPPHQWRPIVYLAAALTSFLVLSVLLQGGIVFLIVTAVVVALVLGIALFVRSLAVTGALVTMAGIALLYYLFFHFIGTKVIAADITCAVLATSLAIVLGRRRLGEEKPLFHITCLSPRIIALNALFFWLLISVADALPLAVAQRNPPRVA
jgi:hypothetical protein